MQMEAPGEGATQLRAKPFLAVHWEMLHHNPSILYFKHITLQIQASRAALPDSHLLKSVRSLQSCGKLPVHRGFQRDEA